MTTTSYRSLISQNRTFLMGIAMIFIVLFHQRLVHLPVLSQIVYFGSWGVDVFLFLSGFGCAFALEKYDKSTFFRRRFWRIFPTCLIVSVIVCLVDIYYNIDYSFLPYPFRLVSLHKWYIQAIVILYLLSPIIYRALKKYRRTGLFISLAVGFAIACADHLLIRYGHFESIYQLIVFLWIFWRFPVFIIGMYIALFDIRLTKAQYIVSFIAFVCAMVLRPVEYDYIFTWPYFLAVSMPCLCYALCMLRSLAIKLHVYKLIELFGLFSLEIYLIHEYVLKILFWTRNVYTIYKIGIFIVILVVMTILVKKSGDFLRDVFKNHFPYNKK